MKAGGLAATAAKLFGGKPQPGAMPPALADILGQFTRKSDDQQSALRQIVRKLADSIPLDSSEQKQLAAYTDRGEVTSETLTTGVAVIQRFEAILRSVVKSMKTANALKPQRDAARERFPKLKKELETTDDFLRDANSKIICADMAMAELVGFARENPEWFCDIDVTGLVERHVSEQ